LAAAILHADTQNGIVREANEVLDRCGWGQQHSVAGDPRRSAARAGAGIDVERIVRDLEPFGAAAETSREGELVRSTAL
jgi:hypothetical protein